MGDKIDCSRLSDRPSEYVGQFKNAPQASKLQAPAHGTRGLDNFYAHYWLKWDIYFVECSEYFRLHLRRRHPGRV